ncbi:high-affinity nickel-transporter [Gloeothece citriformis PCC 7424]|uniref:Nickel/cobalt efflux system n=2 Tax=Gloeothece TaxID=28070 RepID=B7KDP0_GLOC7|nr:high-affinity nickel-transporter [Gloeothece citriformis PCC 7424]
MRSIKQWVNRFCLPFLGAIIFLMGYSLPSQSHVDDLSLLNLVIEPNSAQMNLTLSTRLVAFADTDQNHQLSPQEINQHRQQLEEFFGDRLRLTNSQGEKADVSVTAPKNPLLASNISSNTHSTVFLTYTWSSPITQIKIDYNLFDKLYNTHCLATIFNQGELKNYTLTPNHRSLSLQLNEGRGQLLSRGGLIAFIVAFSWGAIHGLSPGHGKTLVGAYLVGSRAKVKHAIVLGLTTTITHTFGVFVLGIATLFASQYLLPLQFYPWLSLGSGIIIFIIGLNLLNNRLTFPGKNIEHFHEHHHHHDHDHEHHHHHHHHHSHDHLPLNKDDSLISWRSLIGLGVAGGLVPCPAALVLLLSMIALGQISFGLLLVFIFSLGLTGTLTGIGLLLVSAKQFFERIPTQIISSRLIKIIPVVSALIIALIGLGLTYQSIAQIQSV